MVQTFFKELNYNKTIEGPIDKCVNAYRNQAIDKLENRCANAYRTPSGRQVGKYHGRQL